MVTIPVDAHFITLTIPSFQIVTRQVRVGRETRPQQERVQKIREVPPQRKEGALGNVFTIVNQIWGQAGIEFKLRSSQAEKIQAPNNADEVDPSGFLFLAGKFPARAGVSMLLVARFRSGDLGGEAVEAKSACILPDVATPVMFAHELGHLLHLGHEGDIRNLMNAGLSVPTPQLTPKQIQTATQSDLAKKFAGGQ